MPLKLFHSFINPIADQIGFTGAKPSDWNAALDYSNAALSGPSGTDAQIREILSADRTYYVRTDGNDSNTGLVDSAGGAKLTINAAISTIVGDIDFNGRTVTIQVRDGTFGTVLFNKAWTGGGQLNLTGNNATPANCIISGSAKAIAFQNFSIPGPLVVSGFKITSSGDDGVNNGAVGSVNLSLMEFGAVSGSHLAATANGSALFISPPYTVSGNAGFTHMISNAGGYLFSGGGTVTITGSPTVGWWVWCTRVSIVDASGVTFSGSPAAGTTRYNVDSNGVIYTAGGGATYFPGTVAGTSSSGGQYI